MTDKYTFASNDDVLGMIDSDVNAVRVRAESVEHFAISMQSDGKTLALVGTILPELPKDPITSFTVQLVIAKQQEELQSSIDATKGVAPIANAIKKYAEDILRRRNEMPGADGYPNMGFLDKPLRNFDGNTSNDIIPGFTWDKKEVNVGITIAESLHPKNSPTPVNFVSPQGQTKVVDTPSGPKTVPVTTTVNTPAGPKTVWVDSSYAQTAADNARNAVVAAKAAAAAAAQQQEYNRDHQDSGSSSDGGSSSDDWSPTYGGSGSGTAGAGTSTTATKTGTGYIQGGGNYSTSTYGTGNATYTPAPVDRRTLNGHPILIDLDGDGVEFSPLGGSTARFDFDADGFKELTSWVGKDDGLLVYDLGGDGKVSEAKEIAFAEWTAETTDTDLDALKTFAGHIASRNQNSCKEPHGHYHRA